jgi:hypothetical protein
MQDSPLLDNSLVSTIPWQRIDAISDELFEMVIYTYRLSQEESARLWEGVPYVKVCQYNPKHLYPKLNAYGDNGQRSLKL